MKKIGITTSLSSPGYKRLFGLLGEILNFSFEERTFGDDSTVDAWVLLGTDHESVSRIALSDRSCYVVIPDDQLVPCGKSPKLQFGAHPILAGVLSGRQIISDEAVELKSLPKYLQNITALACKEGAPVWAIQEHQKRCHHYVATPIPQLGEGEPLFSYFSGERFLALLPLFFFLNSLSEDRRWEQPPLQASFMFDDPNLHWPTYGFISYPKLLQHAMSYNYHASFATIPLDAWFVHSPTALLFKSNVERLSMAFHGNNHLSNELARPYSAENLSRLLRESLQRIERLEDRAGLKVARVMIPPHGALSEQSLSSLAQLGFEAACTSSGSLHYHNKRSEWAVTVGMRPCDMIAGLPVLPRFGLSASCHNRVLVAALLHQPIIPRAHHQDVAEGFGLLDDLSVFINSLGGVKWTDMKSICRRQYARMIDRDILCVKMLSKRIEVYAPEGINRIQIMRSWRDASVSVPMRWRARGGDPRWSSCENQEFIAVKPREIIDIAAVPSTRNLAEPITPTPRLFPVVRRIMTETRDRIHPHMRRIAVTLRGR